MPHANENARTAAQRPTGLVRRILNNFLVRPLAAARQRRQRRADLGRLSDHALKDIGLCRNDVAYIARYGTDPRPRAANDCTYCDAA